MKNERNGQARALTPTEMRTLLYEGFTCARDRALFAVCFYTACRISEARQMHLIDAFVDGWNSDTVREDILIRKENTKGKQGTRIIPTHPDLTRFLQEYRRDALHLLEIHRSFGDWTHMNLDPSGIIVAHAFLQCPRCGSSRVKRGGWGNGFQRYTCKNCRHRPNDKSILKKGSESETISYNPRGVSCSSNYGFLFANPNNPFLFPGLRGQGCISLDAAIERFEFAFKRTGITGASSHSGRRTALTLLHRERVLLRVIQAISGHKNLDNLQIYLEVSSSDIEKAIHTLD